MSIRSITAVGKSSLLLQFTDSQYQGSYLECSLSFSSFHLRSTYAQIEGRPLLLEAIRLMLLAHS